MQEVPEVQEVQEVQEESAISVLKVVGLEEVTVLKWGALEKVAEVIGELLEDKLGLTVSGAQVGVAGVI